MSTPLLRNTLAAGTLAVSLLVVPACSSKTTNAATDMNVTKSMASPSNSAATVKLAKTKFVANAGLAAGAFYQWLYKPFKAGTFKKGAKGRTAALIKGGLAGAFTYNRLSAALTDAKGDPTLSKATGALSAGMASLKGLASKVRGGTATDADFNQGNNVINGVKSAGAANGATVTNNVPSAGQLTQMVSS